MQRLAVLAAYKLSLFLRTRVGEGFFKQYRRLLSPDVTREEVDELPTLPEEIFDDRPEMAARCRKLYALLGEDPVALSALQLYLLAQMEERTHSLLREGFGLANALTIEAAGRITWPELELIDMAPQLRRAFERAEILLDG